MLFIDFSSAFITIILSKLITKLSDLGINTSLCNWILDFLTNRPRFVRLDSQPHIPNPHPTTAHLYMVLIPSLRLQASQGLLASSATTWLSTPRRPRSSLWTSGKTKGGTHTSIHINGMEVERVTSFKFLGVHISHLGVHEDFSWTLNTSNLVKNAHQRLFFLRK